MHDAAAGGEPLGVAATEAGSGTERVTVVDEPGPHIRDGLEAAVRMGREPRHLRPVVHVPAVDIVEVLADATPGQRARPAPGRRSRRGNRRGGGRRTGTDRSSATACRGAPYEGRDQPSVQATHCRLGTDCALLAGDGACPDRRRASRRGHWSGSADSCSAAAGYVCSASPSSSLVPCEQLLAALRARTGSPGLTPASSNRANVCGQGSSLDKR